MFWPVECSDSFPALEFFYIVRDCGVWGQSSAQGSVASMKAKCRGFLASLTHCYSQTIHVITGI